METATGVIVAAFLVAIGLGISFDYKRWGSRLTSHSLYVSEAEPQPAAIRGAVEKTSTTADIEVMGLPSHSRDGRVASALDGGQV